MFYIAIYQSDPFRMSLVNLVYNISYIKKNKPELCARWTKDITITIKYYYFIITINTIILNCYVDNNKSVKVN